MDLSKILNLGLGDRIKSEITCNDDGMEWNGRRPQNIKSGISQEPLIGSS